VRQDSDAGAHRRQSENGALQAIAIIVGAGSGARFGASRPKQFLDLAGKPLIAHTVARFEAHRLISEIVVVLPRDDFDIYAKLVSGWLRGAKRVQLAPGGSERQDSVWEGLSRIPADHDGLVAVHDAARPLVSETIIRTVIETASKCGGAVAGIPVYETLKEVGETDRVLGTFDRRRLFRAQTPQCFRLGLLRDALTKAREEDFVGTDESSVVERTGGEVRMVSGSETNLKVTTPEDFALVEWYLSRGPS
jgi:2-C-methyl-D-erythritol 4-phosphate cytidylyltransferase